MYISNLGLECFALSVWNRLKPQSIYLPQTQSQHNQTASAAPTLKILEILG